MKSEVHDNTQFTDPGDLWAKFENQIGHNEANGPLIYSVRRDKMVEFQKLYCANYKSHCVGIDFPEPESAQKENKSQYRCRKHYCPGCWYIWQRELYQDFISTAAQYSYFYLRMTPPYLITNRIPSLIKQKFFSTSYYHLFGWNVAYDYVESQGLWYYYVGLYGSNRPIAQRGKRVAKDGTIEYGFITDKDGCDLGRIERLDFSDPEALWAAWLQFNYYPIDWLVDNSVEDLPIHTMEIGQQHYRHRLSKESK